MRPYRFSWLTIGLPILLALRVILEPLGVQLFEAMSGEEAIRLAATRAFAVILLDVQLPGQDGYETAKRIRESAAGKRVPIIFLTGFDDERFPVVEAYRLGAIDYLVKPLIPEILRAKVSGFVELFRHLNRFASSRGNSKKPSGNSVNGSKRHFATARKDTASGFSRSRTSRFSLWIRKATSLAGMKVVNA